ncbi:MAG: hypothetical protein V1915_03925 [Candidatus Bathyarchaeota archaeon]
MVFLFSFNVIILALGKKIADSIVSFEEHMLILNREIVDNSILLNISELTLIVKNLFEDVMTAHFKRDSINAERVVLRILKTERNINDIRYRLLENKLRG